MCGAAPSNCRGNGVRLTDGSDPLTLPHYPSGMKTDDEASSSTSDLGILLWVLRLFFGPFLWPMIIINVLVYVYVAIKSLPYAFAMLGW